MKEFYIYLPSNTEFLPTNTSHNYVTKLAKEITLPDRWQVCLKEIHYPRSWPTLTSYESSFVIMTGADNTWREVTLNSGYYQTSQELINAINRAIYEENMTATYSVSSRRIVMNIPIGTSLHFNFFLKGRFIEINKTLYRIVEKKTRENTRRQIIEKRRRYMAAVI